MKVIGALMDLFKMVDKGAFSGKISFGTARIKSISSFSSKGIYYFPMLLSDQVSLEETKMIAKAVEKTYATFVATCISLIPFHRIKPEDRGSIDSYLKIFHQNIGIAEPLDIGVTIENAGLTDTMYMMKAQEVWRGILAEGTTKRYYDDIAEIPPCRAIHEMFVMPMPAIMQHRLQTCNEDVTTDIGSNHNNPAGNVGEVTKIQTFDKTVFQDQEMKKANDMLPTLIKANVGFVIEGTEEIVQREVIVGVKTFVRRIKSAFLVNELYDTIMTKRKFLRFTKIMTGEEEETMMDLILGLKEIKADAQKKTTGANDILITGKGRKRMANLTAGVLRNNYNPNLTLVMTMNEVNMLKEKGIDLFSSSHVELLIKELFFLGFVILDQANEIAYIQFDSHNYSFQEYPYSSLEREIATNDRMMRELYRTSQR